MTKDKLGIKLSTLERGGYLTVSENELKNIFGPGGLDHEALNRARAFAKTYDCILVYDEFSGGSAKFQRN